MDKWRDYTDEPTCKYCGEVVWMKGMLCDRCQDRKEEYADQKRRDRRLEEKE